jgi:hypothetical protein
MILSAPLRAASAADMHRLHRTNAPRRRADDPVALVRLILRRVRQRAFVILGPTPDRRTRGRSRRRADIPEIGRPRASAA